MSVSDMVIARQDGQDEQHARYNAESGMRGFYLAKVKHGDGHRTVGLKRIAQIAIP